MCETKEKTVGIIGGMGPEATVDILKRIIRLTPAGDDVDHIHCLIDNDPKIPSRIKALIEGDGDDPGPYLARMAEKLQQWGADFLIMPCNTAHYYYEIIHKAVSIPVVHLIDVIAEHVARQFPQHRQVGVVASPAVVMTGLYEKRFQNKGIQIVYPNSVDQDVLFDIIKAVKAGDPGTDIRDRFHSVCRSLADKAGKVIIVACTELSVLSDALLSTRTSDDDLPYLLVDAAECLAEQTVAIAKGQ